MKNEETQHTDEPWTIDGTEIGTRKQHICTAFVGNERKNMVFDNWPANARRIVACVNACKGIDTEKLESFSGKMERVFETNLVFAEQIAKLKAQNAELVEALRETALCLACNATPQEIGIAIAKADDALGKYETNKTSTHEK